MDPIVLPGNYHIVNTVGGGLAIKYHGPGANLTVEVYEPGDADQTWVVAGNPNDSYTISPLPAVPIGLQSEPAGDFVQPLPGGYSWDLLPFVNDAAEGVQVAIQDANELRFWAIEGPAMAPVAGQPVILGESLNDLDHWRFIPFPGP